MSICYECLTEFERSVMIENSKINNEYDKLQTMYEMTCLQLSQIEKEIEHKVFSESGTYDDFSFLLQEATEEVVEKKKGIIQRILDAIKRFFDKLAGKSNDIKSANIGPDEMINVPHDLEEKSTIITKAMAKMQNGIAKLQNGDFTGALDIISVAATPVALVTITGGVAMKQIQKRKGDEISANMDKAKNFFTGAVDKIKGFIPGLKDTKQADDANACTNIIQKMLSAIGSVYDGIKMGISNVFNGKKSENDGQKEQEARQSAHNNILEKPDNTGGKYQIDRTTGVIKHLDKDGKELPVDKNNIPRDIVKAAQHVKGKAAAQAQEAKQKSAERAQVNAKLAQSSTFTPAQTGVRVYVDATSGRVTINGVTVREPLPFGTSENYAKKIFKNYGVTKGYKDIYFALRAAQEGIQASKNEQKNIDARHAKIDRQNRTTVESVCDLMNEALCNSIFEAVIDDDHINLVEYTVDAQTISDELIHALECAGYTVEMTETTYDIYE